MDRKVDYKYDNQGWYDNIILLARGQEEENTFLK